MTSTNHESTLLPERDKDRMDDLPRGSSQRLRCPWTCLKWVLQEMSVECEGRQGTGQSWVGVQFRPRFRPLFRFIVCILAQIKVRRQWPRPSYTDLGRKDCCLIMGIRRDCGIHFFRVRLVGVDQQLIRICTNWVCTNWESSKNSFRLRLDWGGNSWPFRLTKTTWDNMRQITDNLQE